MVKIKVRVSSSILPYCRSAGPQSAFNPWPMLVSRHRVGTFTEIVNYVLTHNLGKVATKCIPDCAVYTNYNVTNNMKYQLMEPLFLTNVNKII